MTGSLVVVGTGIGAARLTTEARAELAGADDVFFLVPDLLSEHAILGPILSALSLTENFGDFLKGVVDSGRLVTHLGITGFFRFLAVRVVDSRRWR